MSEATDPTINTAPATPTDEAKALKARLADLRDARAARESAASTETPDTLREQIAAEELAASDAAAIADAESKHGKVGVGIAYVKTRLGVVIVKRAHSSAFRKFQDLESPKMQDIEQLVRPCVVYPSPDVFDRLITDLPAVLGICGKLIGRLAGGAAQEVAGKS
jgi:hypothetical protein